MTSSAYCTGASRDDTVLKKDYDDLRAANEKLAELLEKIIDPNENWPKVVREIQEALDTAKALKQP